MPEVPERVHTAPIDLVERRVTLEDGRYLIYFTFDETAQVSEAPSDPEPTANEVSDV